LNLSRRDFLKLSTAAPVGAFCLSLGMSSTVEAARKKRRKKEQYSKKIEGLQLKRTVCGVCPIGCGLEVRTSAQNIEHVEGDKRNPISNGRICSRVLALSFLNRSMDRVGFVAAAAAMEAGKVVEKVEDPWEDRIRHRKPGGTDWDAAKKCPKAGKAIQEIASKIISTRGTGETCTSIGLIGGPGMTNEEAYAAAKFCRGLGMLYVDSPARNGYLPAVKALGESFGRMAPTNHPGDIANSDCILIIGANPAVTHPVLMNHVHRAQLRGAKLIVVDPRATETTSKADMHVRLLPGTDMAFIGGMVYSLVRGLDPSARSADATVSIQNEYLRTHTDAMFKINKDFETIKNRGIFSGYDPDARRYDDSTWRYQFDHNGNLKIGEPRRDSVVTLNRLVESFYPFQDQQVADVCGIDAMALEDAVAVYRRTCMKGEAGAVILGNGALCSTNGPQVARAAAILQMLLGNIGVAGGGIYPLADFGNAQGVIDNGLAAEFLPGHLPYPTEDDKTISEYLENHLETTKEPRAKNEWARMGDYLISLLRAWYGGNTDLEQAFSCLPKRAKGVNYGYNGIFDAIEDGTIRGLIVFGDNPAVSAPDADRVKKALAKLEWLVVLDMVQSETATFWKEAAGAQTEVWLLNAASPLEKEGSFTNMGRWIQWAKAGISASRVGPTMRSELQVLTRLREAMLAEAPENFKKMTWDFMDALPALVAREINGYSGNNRQLKSSADIKASGTICGNWLYTGYCSQDIDAAAGVMLSAPCMDRNGGQSELQTKVGLYPAFAWRWPSNVHVLYSRASLDSGNVSWNGRRRLAIFKPDAEGKPNWQDDLDVVDGGTDTSPQDIAPFTCTPTGFAKLFAAGMLDGPFPAYYEPFDYDRSNQIAPSFRTNPLLPKEPPADESKYPYLGVLFHLPMFSHGSARERVLPNIAEIMPGFFIEVGADFATEKGLTRRQKVKLSSPRLPGGGIEGEIRITRRLKAIDGRHVIGIPCDFGAAGRIVGGSGAALARRACDPNTYGAECRFFACNLDK